MALNIQRERYFSAGIEALPADKAGGEEQSFSVDFKVMPIDAQDKMQLETLTDMANFLREVVVGVSDVVDEKGAPVEFSPELMDMLMNQPDFVRLMVFAYCKGLAVATMGN